MRRNELAGMATMGLGAAMIVNALLGPLAFGVIRFRESAAMEAQLLGGELTSLFVAGPLAIVAGALWYRGRVRAPALAMGPLGYALYMCIQYVLVPDYARYPGNNERWFPLYLLMIMTSWIMGREAWREMRARQPIPPRRTTATLLGAVLLGVNLLFAVAWWGSIVAMFVAGPSGEYREHPTGFWLVRLMDLGFVVPLGIVTGLGLLRRKAWAPRMAYAFTGMQALLACAVASMSVRMWLSGDSTPNVMFAIVPAAAALVALYGSLIARARSVERRISLIARYAASPMA